MNAPAALDLASIPERIQSEVQRAIQRSIKGAEYFSTSGPTLGSTPKDILNARGTMNLYHYRPLADEVYRVPVLIVMATTNRGYILDMVPGQSFIEFLLKRGYDVYMLDWMAPKPEEKSLGMEDYVLDFIPDCIRRVQADSGEEDISVIGPLDVRNGVNNGPDGSVTSLLVYPEQRTRRDRLGWSVQCQ
jgi:polyhydroxyalkanoate synthase subunit PhaC